MTDASTPKVTPATLTAAAGPAHNGNNPIAQLSGPGVGVPGQPLTFILTASETGAASNANDTYRVDWNGNGQAVTTVTGLGTGTPLTHVYPATGSFTIKVTATDAAGDSSVQTTLSVTITPTALEIDPEAGTDTTLAVGCPLAGGTVVITPTSADGSAIAVSINGVAQTLPSQPFTHLFVFGQAGVDVIKEVGATIASQPALISIPAILFGGTGATTLSAAGSSAANVLIGGPGTNTLTGGTGRDILIGGGGAATITAGSGDNILIAGSTTYDFASQINLMALLDLNAEWQRTDISYAQRVQDLSSTSSGGVNGAFALDSQTVLPDKVANHLIGGAGADWFFIFVAPQKFDQITGDTDSETITLE